MTSPQDPLFADCPDRHGTGSEKWDRYADRDVLPVWVADMDFSAPPEVLAAIHDRVDHGVFGYTHEPPGFAEGLAAHLERRHGWRVDPERIVGTPGVVTGLALTARLLADPDAEILTFTPVYAPFLTLPGLAERRCVRVPLVQHATEWTIDFEALEAAASPQSKLLWLCHPHNPTGTVFRRADLLKLADFAARHGITVVSDEIWSDLLLDEDHGGERHVPFASLDHPAARAAVTLVAASKTWNLAGLGCAAAILPTAEMRRRWRIAGGGLVPMVNPLGYAASIAAWTHGDPWRRRLIELLRHHRSLVQESVAATPGLSCVPAEATYLSWIDCRGTGCDDPQAACEAAGLGPSNGREFGAPGFIRINTGCPTPRLEEALRRLRRAFGMLACVAAMVVGLLPAARAAEKNVLFIAVDDLKPALGCYGDPHAKTPAIDRLAARGTVFERAYCMQAVCAPSRNAVLTGLRPETLGIYDLGTNFRLRAPTVKTLPEWFKEHGHASHGLGKIFHVGHGNREDPISWSVPHVQEQSIEYVLPESRAATTREEALFANAPGDANSLEKGAAFERADVPDEAYADGRITAAAIERLRGFKKTGERFFLAAGFLKPHLPFCAPARYWDLHDPATLPLADTRVPPQAAPPFAPQFGNELRNYAGIPERGDLPESLERSLVHGYYAAASFMDAQVGRLLEELDALGLADDTIIVLWGDHGWHLGDHGMWCKHTNYEQATRAPLIVVAPGQRGGQRSAAIVEFVDIYPTLCDLAGIPRPAHLQGESLVPLLDEPASPTRKTAFQVYPRKVKNLGPLLGHAVRTDRWRYVEWRQNGGGVAARELYDMREDPLETVNVAADANRADVVAEHAALLATRLAVPPPAGLELRDLATPPHTAAEAKAIAARLADAAGPGGHAELALQADRIALIPADWLVACLQPLGTATPGGANWLRSGLDRAVARLGDAVPVADLAAVVADVTQAPRVRSLAHLWLSDRDAPRADAMLDRMLDDPASELRRQAVEKLLAAADAADDAPRKDAYRRALAAARDVDQIERIVTWLSEHGEPTDLADVLGFVRTWRVSEAFDNTRGDAATPIGFAKAYPPETGDPAVPNTSDWKAVTSTDKQGTIDLNAAIETKKEVLAYAVATVEMPDGGPAEVRIGSPCAVAVWVNGRPLMAHEIYHASEAIDQYVATADFRAGTNTVMVKCCQNEQTEPWAVDWRFRLRICDPLGKPLATQAESVTPKTTPGKPDDARTP